ncbi:hypothetical protein MTO96_009970 [Rhipicephalus appendiculatus]
MQTKPRTRPSASVDEQTIPSTERSNTNGAASFGVAAELAYSASHRLSKTERVTGGSGWGLLNTGCLRRCFETSVDIIVGWCAGDLFYRYLRAACLEYGVTDT